MTWIALPSAPDHRYHRRSCRTGRFSVQPTWRGPRSTIYEDRDGAVSQHFDCLAPQHNCRDPAPPMGGHYNQIAPFCLRRIDNSLERMLVLDMDCIATYTGSRCSVLPLSEVLRCDVRRAFFVLFGRVFEHIRIHCKDMEGRRDGNPRHLGVC